MGIIEIWLVLDHIINFIPHNYFYIQHPDITKYVGTNVVSRFADVSFFTYHTVIFSGVWLILLGISKLLNNTKINKFVRNQSVMSFVMANYVITVTLYTIFEFAGGNPTFGWYGNNYRSIHNVGTNILCHYVYFIITLITFIKVKPLTLFKKYHLLIIIIYAVIYYVTVKITGMYAYKIEWYPYPIFDAISFGQMFGITQIVLCNVLLYISLAIILVGYRVNSVEGIKFRRWANKVLKEYLLKEYIINEERSLVTNENYVRLINKVESLDERVNNIEKEYKPKEFKNTQLFFDGEFYDAYTLIQSLFESAHTEIIIIDNYVDRTILDRLVVKKKWCSNINL